MRSTFHTYVGIDLGGARGKTTAVARLTPGDRGGEIAVEEVTTRHRPGAGSEHGHAGEETWHDEAIIDYLARQLADDPRVAVAVNAPLTLPACQRCQLAVCPGAAVCEVGAVAWLRTTGAELARGEAASDHDRIVAIPSSSGFSSPAPQQPEARRPLLAPYTHRATEVILHHERGLLPRGCVGGGTGPVAARGVHLRRRMSALGFELNHNLLEVSPRATVHALFGARLARGYKRDADPWETRAHIVEELGGLAFSPRSRLSREEVLRNDHCFEALLAGYTAYLWARDGWTMPTDGPYAEDGWIWTPPD